MPIVTKKGPGVKNTWRDGSILAGIGGCKQSTSRFDLLVRVVSAQVTHGCFMQVAMLSL